MFHLAELRKNLKRLLHDAFSYFIQKNATPDANVLTVKRGMKDIQELGQVVALNGKPQMDFWNGMPCNEIKGTDTTIYPPFLKPHEDIYGFGVEICRYF